MPTTNLPQKRSVPFILLLVVLSASFLRCDNDPTSIEKSDGQTYQVPDNVYFKPVDPNRLVTVAPNGTNPLVAAANQLVVLTDSEIVREENADTIASAIGGELVGQTPYLGVYQFEFTTTTLAELNAKRNAFMQIPGIREVSYNRLPQYRADPAYCDRTKDNFKLSWQRRAAFEHIFYPTLEPLMAKVRQHISLSKVVVGLFDSGLNSSIGQFDDLRTRNMIKPGTTLVEADTAAHGHGTMVAGFIGADSRDGATNGIASAVLDDKLEMAVTYDTLTTAALAYYIYVGAFIYGIDVFNMSFGYGGPHPDTTLPSTRRLLKAVFHSLSQCLFVVAADNKPFVLDTTNDAPAGIQLDNVITVGGTMHDKPDSACSFSSRGPLIDIAAPADQVTCVDPVNPGRIVVADGNSFATPMITSIAAVLKSISSALTPAQIKSYIKTNSYPTSSLVGGRRLILPLPVEQLLIDMPAPKPLLDLVDIDIEPGKADNPGLVMHRICGGSHISIKGYGSVTFLGDTAGVSNINAFGVQITCASSISTLGISLHDYHCIGESFPFVQETGSGTATAELMFVDTTIIGGGTAIAGSITVTRCEITARNAIDQNPIMLRLEGVYSGVLEWTDQSGTLTTKEFDGALSLPLLYAASDPAVTQYLERNCVGGREYGNAS